MPVTGAIPTHAPHRAARAGLAAAALLVALLIPSAASAAKLRPVADLRVSAVNTNSISLAWSDHSKGESSYQVQSRDGDGIFHPSGAKGDEKAKVKGLLTGSLYNAQVRACKGSNCAAWSNVAVGETLLSPFNGPHPDPGCSTFPASDAFNQEIATAPVDPRSDQIIHQINSDGDDMLHPDFGSNPRYGIPYVVVPPEQPLVPIHFTAYGDESDPGPYPIPPGAPVEGGVKSNDDRHVIVVREPSTAGGPCSLFELYRAFEKGGVSNKWNAGSGALFDLGAPLVGQRPDGWTSADAGGLPIYPGLITYEEVQSGQINHAIRVTFDETRAGYVSPASHAASSSCNPNRPPMGMRLRLKAGYDISGFSGESLVIATALKRYGVINADNGSNWFISGSTDPRWNNNDLNQLKQIPASAFEVVSSGPETTDC